MKIFWWIIRFFLWLGLYVAVFGIAGWCLIWGVYGVLVCYIAR